MSLWLHKGSHSLVFKRCGDLSEFGRQVNGSLLAYTELISHPFVSCPIPNKVVIFHIPYNQQSNNCDVHYLE